MTEVEELFSELSHLVKTNHYDKAAKVCDEILKVNPKDQDAFVYKVTCLIYNKDVEGALKIMEESPFLSKGLTFEKAYCLYRARKYEECHTVIKSSGQSTEQRFIELEAQVLYRLQDYVGSVRLYQSLLDDPSFSGNKAEVRTNLFAAYVGLNQYQRTASTKGLTFEEIYNSACLEIGAGNYEQALELLVACEREAVEQLSEEGLIQEEIADELAAVRAQRGFVLQLLKRATEAAGVYASIQETTISDDVVGAVVANNVVCLKGNTDLFESFKSTQRFHRADGSVEAVMTPEQRRCTAINRALLLMHMKKGDQCRSLLKKLQEEYPDAEEPVLIAAALHLREKNAGKAIDALKAYATSHPAATRVQLSLAQLACTENGGVKQALSALRSLDPETAYQPAVVATVIAMLESTGSTKEAAEVFAGAQAFWKAQELDSDGKSRCAKMITKAHASFLMRNNMKAEAVEVYQALVKLDPSDLSSLASLVIAVSTIDPVSGEKYLSSLPAAAALGGSSMADAEALEEATLRARGKRSRERQRDKAITQDEGSTDPAKNKRKKKKKPRLPKDLSIPPDPERWLPKRERSGYRKKKDKGRKKTQKSRGVQGGQSESESAKFAAKTKEEAPVAPPPSASGGKKGKKGKKR